MFKLAGRIIKLGILLIIVVAVIGYFNINHLLSRAIETQATNSLNLKTTVGGARLGLLGGSLSISDLQIASPSGFSAPQMLALQKGGLQVSYRQLTDTPIHIPEVTLSGPTVVVEQNGGKFNYQALMDQIPKPDPNAQPVRLIIDKLTIADATVVLRPGLPGLDNEIRVPIPSLILDNVGRGQGNQNGAAIKEVVLEVITALVQKSGQMGSFSEQLKSALNSSARSVQQQVQGAIAKELDKALQDSGLGNLGSDLSKSIGGTSTSPDNKKTEKRKRDR